MYNKIYNYQDNRVHGHGLKSQDGVVLKTEVDREVKIWTVMGLTAEL